MRDILYMEKEEEEGGEEKEDDKLSNEENHIMRNVVCRHCRRRAY